MKNHIKTTVLGLAFLIIGLGCDSLKDTYGEYIIDGETTYIGAPDSIIIGHGVNKLRFWLFLNADPKISNGVIKTSDGSVNHEFEVSSKRNGQDTLKIDLALQEGEYTFEVFLMDGKGNTSVRREIGSKVYGKTYQNLLINRSILSIENYTSGSVVHWDKPGTGSVGTLLTYETKQGDSQTVEVANSESKTMVENYIPGGKILVSSTYRPTQTSFELFEGIATETNFPEEVYLDKGLITALKLPGDAGEGCYGSTYSRLFDGDLDQFWHSCESPEDSYPFVMSFDVGVLADISRFRLDERADCCQQRSPKAFQLWGTNSLDGAETISISENSLESWESDALTKGWVKLLDVEDNGDTSPEVELSGDGNSYRYIRFVAISSINGDSAAGFNELTFWSR